MITTRLIRLGLIVGFAALVPAVFVLLAGQSLWRVLTTLVLYAFGPQGWSEVLVHAIPLTLIGLGVAFALRAGLFNIGGAGQFIAGTVVSVFFAPYFGGLGLVGLLAFLTCGFIGGVLHQGSHAVQGAVQMVSYLIRGPMADPMPFWPRSYMIPPDCILPVLVPGTRLHAGLIVALAMVIVFAIIQHRTVFGFQSLVLGANPGAAIYAGFRVKALTVLVMAVSGGLGGLAGAVEVGGLYQRIVDNMGEGFGLAGIAVALIARLEPIAIPFAACLFGIFFAGGGALQRELALPFPLVWIVEATVIFAVAALHWALPDRKVAA